jgi:hypothetical protein
VSERPIPPGARGGIVLLAVYIAPGGEQKLGDGAEPSWPVGVSIDGRIIYHVLPVPKSRFIHFPDGFMRFVRGSRQIAHDIRVFTHFHQPLGTPQIRAGAQISGMPSGRVRKTMRSGKKHRRATHCNRDPLYVHVSSTGKNSGSREKLRTDPRRSRFFNQSLTISLVLHGKNFLHALQAGFHEWRTMLSKCDALQSNLELFGKAVCYFGAAGNCRSAVRRSLAR